MTTNDLIAKWFPYSVEYEEEIDISSTKVFSALWDEPWMERFVEIHGYPPNAKHIRNDASGKKPSGCMACFDYGYSKNRDGKLTIVYTLRFKRSEDAVMFRLSF